MVQTHGMGGSRRRFLMVATRLGAAGAIVALRANAREAEDPFDSLPGSVWKRARYNGLVMIHRPAPSDLPWRTQIAGKNEPGQRLIVEGLVVAPDGKTPAEGVTVYAYNTDAQGYYGENRAEYPPRLCGWMKTDAAGRFELRTIMPGCYPGMRVPAHIHFSAWGAGYPPQWVDALRFEVGRYINSELLAGDASKGEFRTIRKLTSGEDRVLRCDFKIRLQWRSNFE